MSAEIAAAFREIGHRQLALELLLQTRQNRLNQATRALLVRAGNDQPPGRSFFFAWRLSQPFERGQNRRRIIAAADCHLDQERFALLQRLSHRHARRLIALRSGRLSLFRNNLNQRFYLLDGSKRRWRRGGISRLCVVLLLFLLIGDGEREDARVHAKLRRETISQATPRQSALHPILLLPLAQLLAEEVE